MNLHDRIQSFLTDLPPEQRRTLRDVFPTENGYLEIDGKRLVDFASNDYLGLSMRPELARGATEWMKRFGTGSRASRLVSGNLAGLSELEGRIAELKGTQSALIFGSGFQANSSILAALLDRRLRNGDQPVQVFTDRLCHASFHFGLAAADIRQHRYRHNDLTHLQQLLEKYDGDATASLIATESVFSMEGDRLDLDTARNLARQHDAMLYIDEAHATGVFGDAGQGLVTGAIDNNEVIVGTFGKALGGYGSYVACPTQIRDYLINRCTGLIYSTGLPPMVLGAIQAALDLLPNLGSQRLHLQKLADQIRNELKSAGFDTLNSNTHIVPIVVGQDHRVLELASGLMKNGFLVAAIRPPTVPVGTARLRVSLSSVHTESQVHTFVETLRRLANDEASP